MPLTSAYLPGGVVGFGFPFFGAPVFTTGKVWFVSSTSSRCQDDPGHGKSPDTPFATLDYAIGRVDANSGADRGDVIVLMPNHAETITGIGGITADVAGITILGLGTFNQRPRFLMDGAATVTFAISAADVTVRNCVFASGHADVVTCFDVTAKGATIVECEFVDNVANENFLSAIKCTSTSDNNADGLKVIGCRYLSPDAACEEMIETNADVDGMVLHGNLYVCEAATAGKFLLSATGKDFTNCQITWNFNVNGMTANDLFIDNDTTANTGIVAHNRCGHHDVTGAHSLIDCDGVRLFDNLSVSTDTSSGFVLPAIDVDL